MSHYPAGKGIFSINVHFKKKKKNADNIIHSLWRPDFGPRSSTPGSLTPLSCCESSAFTAAQVSDHQASHAAMVFTSCPQTRHSGGEERGKGETESQSVVSGGSDDSRGRRGLPGQRRPQLCDEIRAKTIKDGASFAVWT